MKSLAAATCLLLIACSGAPKERDGQFEVASEHPKGSSPSDEASEPGAKEDQPEAPDRSEEKPVTFTGVLQKTSVSSFGASDDCTYEMVLEDVAVEVTMLVSARAIVSATVKNRTHESTVQCQHGPMEPTNQSFTLREFEKDMNGRIPITFDGDPGNRPKTDLTAKLSPEADGLQMTLQWHRSDLGKPYDWSVAAKIPLASK
jgi:hypothetical protein